MDERIRTILEHLVEKENETWAVEGNGFRRMHFDASTLSDEDLIRLADSAYQRTQITPIIGDNRIYCDPAVILDDSA